MKGKSEYQLAVIASQNMNKIRELYGADNGAMEIAYERIMDVMLKEKDADYDDKNNYRGELLACAKFLLTGNRNLYPKNWEIRFMVGMEKMSQRDKLIQAGALIAREIDRLDRAEKAAEERKKEHYH